MLTGELALLLTILTPLAAVIGIAVLTWVLMPRLTDRLGPWLRRRPGS